MNIITTESATLIYSPEIRQRLESLLNEQQLRMFKVFPAEHYLPHKYQQRLEYVVFDYVQRNGDTMEDDDIDYVIMRLLDIEVVNGMLYNLRQYNELKSEEENLYENRSLRISPGRGGRVYMDYYFRIYTERYDSHWNSIFMDIYIPPNVIELLSNDNIVKLANLRLQNSNLTARFDFVKASDTLGKRKRMEIAHQTTWFCLDGKVDYISGSLQAHDISYGDADMMLHYALSRGV